MDGNRLAIIDFPDPGGPMSKMLCPPAHATSKARFTFSCPFTSEKSRSKLFACVRNISRVSISVGCNSHELLKKPITSVRLSAPYTFRRLTTAASITFALGTMMPSKPSSRALMAIGSTPFIGWSEPSSDSSPISINRLRRSALIFSSAASMPTAIGKS